MLPPSINILKKRLLLRHKNDPQVALKRFSSAKKDIMHWNEYDFVFVNDNLNECTNSIFKKIKLLFDEIKRMEFVIKKIKKL